MRSIRLLLAYDGTAFHGWQAQPGMRTVQGVLEKHLKTALDHEVRTQAAGRTDAGVHARGQVVSFATGSALPVAAIAARLRRSLPDDVIVHAAAEAPAEFEARRSARARRYTYRLLDQNDVLLRRIAWRPRIDLDLDALERAMRPLHGEHDFAAFMASGSAVTCPRCQILRASWRRWEGGAMLDIVADHFLYRMVRNVVGTSLRAMRERDPAAAMAGVLGSRDRARAGVTAPPQGLCLEQVFYDEDVSKGRLR